jgi:Fuc2NAc and GlcNAc transferase
VHRQLALVAVATFAGSWLLTMAVRTAALRSGLLDVPNARSSHDRPTPTGGGVAIASAATIAVLTLYALRVIPGQLMLSLVVGGGAIAVVGFIDDRISLPAGTRLAVHTAAALWVLALYGGLPPMQFGEQQISFGVIGYVLGVAAIVWTVNLFNFMDGIDGIAAAEAAFVFGAGAALDTISGTAVAAPSGAIVLAGACLGFLFWNWAPAKIFMGDVGSGYLGYMIVVLAIASARNDPTALLSWLILGGVFFCDATVTLARRLLRRDRVHEAHRSHAYQWLARRWHSHSRVTIATAAINFCWLLPCALFAARHPGLAAWTTVVAFAPVALLVLFTGAGRAET